MHRDDKALGKGRDKACRRPSPGPSQGPDEASGDEGIDDADRHVSAVLCRPHGYGKQPQRVIVADPPRRYTPVVRLRDPTT